MKALSLAVLFFLLPLLRGQTFRRMELPTTLDIPWEIQYGPDGYLWVSETYGEISRIHPFTGAKQTIFRAPDFYLSGDKERLKLCHKPKIISASLGMALHPDFMDSSKSFIYYYYTYNAGSVDTPNTKFKISRLKWDKTQSKITQQKDIVTHLPTSYDHIGGRLMCAKQKGQVFLYLSIGDLGISELSSPNCYTNQADNPNNFTQSLETLNGKILRFDENGNIPANNPINNSPIYTRGHRNAQGLCYNPRNNMVYEVEHGDRTDDEVNVLHAGMNYGWKNVHGYTYDNNVRNEQAFVKDYSPNPKIPNDSLVSPIYSWCQDTTNSTNYLDWCTVAPSDVEYYGSNAIAQWSNSLLVTTLKKGNTTQRSVQVLRLSNNGKTVKNIRPFFTEHQDINGRLRDLCISPNGKRIYLINNGGTDRDKIIVYEYVKDGIHVRVDPIKQLAYIDSEKDIREFSLFTIGGKQLLTKTHASSFKTTGLSPGFYAIKATTDSGEWLSAKFVLE